MRKILGCLELFYVLTVMVITQMYVLVKIQKCTLKRVNFTIYKLGSRASLVLQWLRIRLPMQGTRVRALVWEDPTCRGATGPVSHNY